MRWSRSVWRALSSRKDIERWFLTSSISRPNQAVNLNSLSSTSGQQAPPPLQSHRRDSGKENRLHLAIQGRGRRVIGDFELFPEGNKTKVKLTHDGSGDVSKIAAICAQEFRGRLDTTHRRVAKGFCRDGGAGDLHHARVRQRAARAGLAGDDGSEATAELVGTARFLQPTSSEMDVRLGGALKHVMHGLDGTNYPNKSIFKEVVKPEKLVFAHGGGRENGPGATFVATWTFDEVGKDKNQSVHPHGLLPTTEWILW